MALLTGAMITGLLSSIFGGITDHFKQKQELKKAIHENKMRLALDQQEHNQSWEMKSLENAGWKDDALFFFFIGLFIWTGFDPEGGAKFFENLKVLPDWFVQTWMWLVASVLGVKKIGEYGPAMVKGFRAAMGKPTRPPGEPSLVDQFKQAAEIFLPGQDKDEEKEEEDGREL